MFGRNQIDNRGRMLGPKTHPQKKTIKADALKSWTFCQNDERDFQAWSNFENALNTFPFRYLMSFRLDAMYILRY